MGNIKSVNDRLLVVDAVDHTVLTAASRVPAEERLSQELANLARTPGHHVQEF